MSPQAKSPFPDFQVIVCLLTAGKTLLLGIQQSYKGRIKRLSSLSECMKEGLVTFGLHLTENNL